MAFQNWTTWRHPLVAVLLKINICFSCCGSPPDDWRQFRGCNCTGKSSENVKLEWGPELNITWKINLPGPGSSSPIIIGDRIFLTSYAGYGVAKKEPGDIQRLVRILLCIDMASGREIWRRDIPSAHKEDPYSGYLMEHGYASSTPVSDGKRVFTFFGKSGVFAFDLDGNQLWNTSVGTESDPYKFGDGSSPILYKNLVIVNGGNSGRAVVALDQESGKVAWETKNEGYKNSWATPIIVSAAGRDELVLPFPKMIDAFAPETGEVLWHVDTRLADSIYGTLVEHNGVVMGMGGKQQQAIGVRCGGNGNVSDTHVVWTSRLQSSIGTPLVVGDNLLWASQGQVYSADCRTGKLNYSEPLAGGAVGHRFDYPSPIQVGDEILFLYKTGKASVIAASDQFQLIRENDLGAMADRFNGTPAISGRQIVIRSDKNLYSIELPEKN